MLCNLVFRCGIVVQLERAGELRDATVVGAVSGGVACVHETRWSDDRAEVDLTSLEETYCEAELERAAAATVAREAMHRAETVPAFLRCA